jgi:hypothetical protein
MGLMAGTASPIHLALIEMPRDRSTLLRKEENCKNNAYDKWYDSESIVHICIDSVADPQKCRIRRIWIFMRVMAGSALNALNRWYSSIGICIVGSLEFHKRPAGGNTDLPRDHTVKALGIFVHDQC